MSHRQATCLCFVQRALIQREHSILFVLMLALLLLVGTPQPAVSQTYQVIHNFTAEGSDGATPYGGPTLDPSGNVFGTTSLGGTNADGTVYDFNGSSWTFNTIYNFASGLTAQVPASVLSSSAMIARSSEPRRAEAPLSVLPSRSGPTATPVTSPISPGRKEFSTASGTVKMEASQPMEWLLTVHPIFMGPPTSAAPTTMAQSLKSRTPMAIGPRP